MVGGKGVGDASGEMVAVAVGVGVAVEAVSATNGTKPRCLGVAVGVGEGPVGGGVLVI